MWDKFDLWLFEKITEAIQRNFEFTRYEMGMEIFWLCATALLGQGLACVINEINRKNTAYKRGKRWYYSF